MDKTNAKPGTCSECGGVVAPGEGRLWWEAGPDDGGDVAGRAPAGWRVKHLDASACASASRASKSSDRAAATREFRRRAAALGRTFFLGQPGVSEELTPPAGERVEPHPSAGPARYVIAEDRICRFVGCDAGTSLPRTPELESAVRALATGPAGGG